MQIIIAGGGIGGLVAALHLNRIGCDVRVFESVPEIRALGVGINLLPHSVRELTLLGLGDKLAEAGVATAELAYYSKHGKRIWREARGMEAGYLWPQYSIHRGRLQMILLEAVKQRLPPGRVATGHHLEEFVEDRDGVVARFVDRRSGTRVGSMRADMLIAADGIHSTVRRHFHPKEGPPKFSGQVLWRGTSLAAPFLSGRSMIMAGHMGQKFVAYPISGASPTDGLALINWIAEIRIGGDIPPPSDWNRAVDKEKFRPRFADWRFDWLDVPGLIDGAESVYEFPMVDRDPLPRWSTERVTLLGDAAHPMYPIGSNGASQAILDAGALAEAILPGGKSGEMLARYEAVRRDKTAEIVRSNRRMGPERCMQIVEERAPEGFDRLDEVISQAELETIAAEYKSIAGFDRDALNARGAA